MSPFDTVYDDVEYDARRPASCRYSPDREDTYYSNQARLTAMRVEMRDKEDA